ncbi:MAG: nickel pincer cofactor biosynthesis protein LarB [Thermoplasmatota archaeon]
MAKTVGDFANLDLARETRTGIPEIVLADTKTDAQLVGIVRAFAESRDRVLVSRLAPERVALFADLGLALDYRADARVLIASKPGSSRKTTGARVAILAAGTADVAVAEEARAVAEEMGCDVATAYDVGVAGIHRLYPALDRIEDADVVIVAAGREGALATVVAGLVSKPVIGLPVSTGYGHGGAGETALAAMLQSCAMLTVVNIDAGAVAGACAAQIANSISRARSTGTPVMSPDVRRSSIAAEQVGAGRRTSNAPI